MEDENKINWNEARKKSFNTKQGTNRIKVFKETYRGIPYEIHVIYQKGYEQFKKEFDNGMWATLEIPEGMEALYQAIENFIENAGGHILDDGFLYHDTAHSYNEGQDINTRIKEMRQEAHNDIDYFYKYLEKAGYVMHGLKEIVDTIQEKDNTQDTH